MAPIQEAGNFDVGDEFRRDSECGTGRGEWVVVCGSVTSVIAISPSNAVALTSGSYILLTRLVICESSDSIRIQTVWLTLDCVHMTSALALSAPLVTAFRLPFDYCGPIATAFHA